MLGRGCSVKSIIGRVERTAGGLAQCLLGLDEGMGSLFSKTATF